MRIITLLVFLSLTVSTSLTAQDGGRKIPKVDIKNIDQSTFNTGDITNDGKPIIISFWATWCSPCKRELDAIAEIYPDWQEDYNMELLAVTIDDARGVAKVPAMVASKGWDYTILSDSKQELQRALNFQTVPQTFLLDANGEIIYTHSGYTSGDEYDLEDHIKKAAGK